MADKPQQPVLVAIRIKSTDEQGHPVEDMRMMAPGTLTCQAEDTYLLRYTETMQDEDTGASISAEVRLKLQPAHVIMMRTGQYGTTMVFTKGQRFEGTYHTPYGDMGMAVYTTRLLTTLSPQRGRLVLDYQLDMNGGFGTMRHMVIDYGVEEGKDAHAE